MLLYEPGHIVEVVSIVAVWAVAQCYTEEYTCLGLQGNGTLWWPSSFARFCRAGSMLSWCQDEATDLVPVHKNTRGFWMVGWGCSSNRSFYGSPKQFSTTRDIHERLNLPRNTMDNLLSDLCLLRCNTEAWRDSAFLCTMYTMGAKLLRNQWNLGFRWLLDLLRTHCLYQWFKEKRAAARGFAAAELYLGWLLSFAVLFTFFTWALFKCQLPGGSPSDAFRPYSTLLFDQACDTLPSTLILQCDSFYSFLTNTITSLSLECETVEV